MIVTFFRSSSYNCWDFCPQQYFLTYVLGLKPTPSPGGNGWRIPKPQMKADKGTITHKALELLACAKLAMQEGRPTFSDDETGREFAAPFLTPEDALHAAWEHYTEKLSHWDWQAADYRDCRSWVFDALAFNGGAFDPRRRTVIWPEKHFDIAVEEDWARYSYPLPDGTRLEGHLGLKGTIDLVCRSEADPDVVELVDWKTGQRKDWATGQAKDYRKLRKDPQLRLYHYALSRLCPWAKEIFITIVFIRDGGPFSLPFTRDDLPETEAMLRARFDAVRDCQLPPLIWNDPAERWKCNKLCAFGMNNWAGGQKTVCRHVRDELVQLGMDRVTARYGDKKALTSYGSGGGQDGR